MTYRTAQPNFSRGEIAPELYGRDDVDTWQSSVRKARNVIILKYGGLTKRPGTELVSEVLDASAPTRLVPFEFSLEQTYALEMGQGYMAPCALGGRVLEEELAITAITAAANAQISAAFHGYVVGQHVWLSGVSGSMGGLLNSRRWTVTGVPNDGAFTINADTTGLTYTNATGGVVRVGVPAPLPAPPVVPPIVPPAPPPYVGGGGGGGGWREYREFEQ